MPPDAPAGLFESLLTNYGPPGIIIAVLLYVVKIQYDRNNLLVDNLSKALADSSAAQSASTAALTRLTDNLVGGRNRGAE